ncbi:MAG: outer membrane beta-barrel protein, partial [Verrucomicrobiia bacterium]
MIALHSTLALLTLAAHPSDLDEVTFVQTSRPGLILSGYVDAGYLYNFTSRSGGSTIQNRLNNDGSPGGRFSLHAAKLVLEKPLPDENRWAGGFRADVMIGEDAAFFGQNAAGTDSLYLQQAFALLRLPVGNGIDLAVGKYQSLIGFEAEERPANLNITPGIVSLIDPGWLVGGYAVYPLNDNVGLALGLGNGNGVDGLLSSSTPPGDFLAITGFLEITNPEGNALLQTGFYTAPNGDPGYLNPLDAPPLRRSNLAIWNTFGTWAPQAAGDRLLL